MTAAASNREMDSFLSKFKYLCSAGFKAAVSFKSEDFVTRVSMDVELPFALPALNPPPPFNVTTPKFTRHRSPSYYRRLRRRRSGRIKSDEIVTEMMETSVTDVIVEEEVPQNVKACEDTVEDRAAEDFNNEPRCDVELDSQANLVESNPTVTGDVTSNAIDSSQCCESAVEAVVDEETDTIYEESIRQDDAAKVGNAERLLTVDESPNYGGDFRHLGTSYVGHYPMPKLEFLKF